MIYQKDKEDLEEISTELELADEDDKVPYEVNSKMFVIHTDILQLQDWRFFLQSASTGGPGTAHSSSRTHRH